ncbi:DMT family transporter [Limobrevibacterium gyesilva]|uniref:DMT family transporter n=1 Tax=Limobrevibacterium gyesilva TaxID=2991712 RepID=A0AA41YJV5_9PROT|nr:DMT family transporter [Limobrevibacterium gyesilva]MCW3475056.1 DMT family transporter [Limobrevibacterium gyesilva]
MDNPLRGIALILGATMLFSLSDAMAKYLGQHLPVIEIAWIRYVIFVIFAAGLIAPSGLRRLRVRSQTLQLMRGLTLVGSAVFFIFGLRYLPLADAASVGFVSPLLITMLSVPMLREVVGIRRWAAIVVGFLGVLIVVRPGTGAFQPAAFLVVTSSLCWAIASILTRKMAGADDAATTLLWSAVSGLVVLTILLPFDFVMPSAWLLAVALVLGIVASAGQYLMVLAYRYAGASLLAPFSYVQLIWAVALGYLVFGSLPDQWTLLGAGIIVGSGIYTVHRERIRARERAAA